MWQLYLDESGDLGFNFKEKKSTSYFTITILIVKNFKDNREIANAAKKTLKRKLNTRKKRKRIVTELKANKTSIAIKKYFYKQLENIYFEIYSVTLDKHHIREKLEKDKNRLYNFIARMTIQSIHFEKNLDCLDIIIDKSKNKSQIGEFNFYVINQLEAMLDIKIPINIYHRNSENDYGLQAADLFSWGIFRKYEIKDFEWFNIFREKVRYDAVYP